ncbi:MAG: Vgb family protein [Planctomycetota bacterium]|jgi:sugar lactone lactonase YvrE
MRPRPSCALALFVLGAALVPNVRAQDDDYYISVPSFGAIFRVDAETGVPTPFAAGMAVPFYGVWADDGNLYMPDRTLGVVFRVGPTGDVSTLTAGGFLESPITAVLAPDDALIVSDIFLQTIVHVDAVGTQTLIADAVSSNGLLDGPGGLAMGSDGLVYVSNNLSNSVVVLDPDTGDVQPVSDGQGLLDDAGGIVVDNAGNAYVANYGSNTIVRILLETGEARIFCDDPAMISPNDVRLAPQGGLHVTTKNSSLVHIDARGQLTLLHNEPTFGAYDGVAMKAYRTPCNGAFVPYGTGLAGAGGFEPRLRGLFAPCPGVSAAIEMEQIAGGALGSLAWGLSPVSVPFKQGQLLVSLGPPGGLIPLAFPGVGPGGGALTLDFQIPQVASLIGVSVYLQVLVSDPGAPAGVAMSNGLEERIGG